jgi:amino acid adenylation domain-containing protein
VSDCLELLASLARRDIRLALADGELRVNAPRGALTPALAEALRERKAEIVAVLEQGGAGAVAPPIAPVPRTGALPLSFSQQRLWFLEQLGSGATYSIPAAFELAGALDSDALQRTLTEIVRRHESLRTGFDAAHGQPRQVIQPPAAVPLPLIDLRGLPAPEQVAALKRHARAETLKPFDLARGPMLRALLLRLADAAAEAPPRHALLLTLHHIAADGWSLGVLVHELTVLYQAFARGEPSPLPELAVQVADVACWQRDRLQGAALEAQLRYWRERLAGAPELLQLPTDLPRPPVQTLIAGKVDFALDAALTERLRRLGRDAGATLFMVLLAAFQVLLSRYSGQEDIVVDAPIANRHHQALEPLIGLFVNDLALRADLSGNPRFSELLAQVRATALAAFEHQDLPFDRLVEALKPQRHLGYNPVTQVALALQNAPMAPVELPGLRVTPLDAEAQQTRMDLELHLWERPATATGDADAPAPAHARTQTPTALAGSCIYNASLFLPETIERLCGHFRTLLAAIAADPARPIAELPLLDAAERRRVLLEWNAERGARAPKACLHRLFEAQAARTPHAVAVAFAGQELTYAELNARANRLAHALLARGVGPDAMVALCVEHSFEMIVGMLGILKAGGAYVPLDPAYPAERLAFILEELRTPVLLTQRHLLPALPAHGSRVLALDDPGAGLADQPATNPDSPVTPAHLAYVIYTSGSTGKPKGVLVEHASVTAHCADYRRRYGLSAADRVLQLASFHFDASVEQIFPALLTGARVVVPDWEPDPVAFAEHLVRCGVTVLDLAGAHLRVLLRAWTREPALIDGHALRIVVVGADVLPVELVEAWRQGPLAAAVRLFNVYGPTEATVAATVHEIDPAQDCARPRIPIGTRLPSKRLYVLDAAGQPAPIGVGGELCIGGPGPARGYLDRPELTAARFRTLVLAAGTESIRDRVYRTGDLVRWLPDGRLDFLGRIDQQVKIRGFRVELGEIEAVLGEQPPVQEAAVLAREDAHGERRLVAYTAPRLAPADIAELRAQLKLRLPAYMVPEVFVTLPALPHTPVGVLDRRALPAPDPAAAASAHEAPGSALERQIAAVWEQVLGRPGIGIHDSFFEVGGHSLLAMEVHGRLREAFPVLTIVDLFSYPTIQALARHLDATAAPPADFAAVRERGSRRRARQATKARQAHPRRDHRGEPTA